LEDWLSWVQGEVIVHGQHARAHAELDGQPGREADLGAPNQAEPEPQHFSSSRILHVLGPTSKLSEVELDASGRGHARAACVGGAEIQTRR
jgi:hypothetical protein